MTEKMGVALDLMRLEGIVKMLNSSLDESDLKEKYLSVTGQGKVDNIKKALTKLTKPDLRKIIDMSPAITEEIVVSFYNEYRYGRKPGFVLYWANKFIGKSIKKENLKQNLSDYLVDKRYNDDARFKDLKCIAVDSWSERGSSVFEIGFTYLKKYSYITQNNNFEYIHELIDCFAWISIEKGFVALYNMPPTVESIIKQAILNLYGVKLLGLSLERSMLDDIIDPANRKKVSLTHYDSESEKPQKVTFADPHFADKQDTVLANYTEYDMNACLYNEEIDAETIATLGVNNRGKLYLNKNVTTTQFRRWSVSRIMTIIDYFTDVFSTEGIEKFQHIQLFTSGDWGRLSSLKRNILNSIAKTILICKEKGVTHYPIDISSIALNSAFPSDTSYCFLLMCDNCSETTIPECTHCQKSIFKITSDRTLICETCGNKAVSLKCECGSIISANDADSLMCVTLKETFLSKIISELQAIAPTISLADNEFIVIHNGYLKIQNSNGFKRLHPKDLNCFSTFYSFNLTENDYTIAKTVYAKLNEKCTIGRRFPTNEMCEACNYKMFNSVNDLQCIQQILSQFKDFIPRPHQGHEYGDMSINIQLDGKSQNMQGILKSDIKKITRSSQTGREILDQALKALMDVRTEIICVIAPTTFDNQLVETLTTLSRHFNKKILFWDFDFMARLLTVFIRDRVKGESA